MVFMSVEMKSSYMRPNICVFNTGADPNLVIANILEPALLGSVRYRDLSKIRDVPNKLLATWGTIIGHLSIGESSTRVAFDIEENLAATVSLATTFLIKVIKSVHSAQRKFVAYHSTAVPILVLKETRSADEWKSSDNRKHLKMIWLYS